MVRQNFIRPLLSGKNSMGGGGTGHSPKCGASNGSLRRFAVCADIYNSFEIQFTFSSDLRKSLE
jgi:hypothetical protein